MSLEIFTLQRFASFVDLEDKTSKLAPPPGPTLSRPCFFCHMTKTPVIISHFEDQSRLYPAYACLPWRAGNATFCIDIHSPQTRLLPKFKIDSIIIAAILQFSSNGTFCCNKYHYYYTLPLFFAFKFQSYWISFLHFQHLLKRKATSFQPLPAAMHLIDPEIIVQNKGN